MEWSSAHTPAAEDELLLAFAYCYEDLEEDISLSLPSLLVLSSSKSPVSPKIPPSFPIPPPQPITANSSAPSPLFPVSPSAPLLNPLCCMDLLQVFQSPALPWQEDPLALPPVTEAITPPQVVNQSAPSWLLPPLAPPGTIVLMDTPGSLVSLDPPWSP